MKTKNTIYLVVTILIFSGATAFSQNGSHKVYYPENISIDYSGKSFEAASSDKFKII